MEADVNKILLELIGSMSETNLQIDQLLALGYDQHFELVGNKVMDTSSRLLFHSWELSVDYLYHMDEVGYVFGISHSKKDIRGILVLYSSHELHSLKFLKHE